MAGLTGLKADYKGRMRDFENNIWMQAGGSPPFAYAKS